MSHPLWSRIVHELTPYVPGEQPKGTGLVKLNTNENPYGPSPRVLAAIAHSLSEQLRLYPDPTSSALRTTVADYYHLSPNQVFVGNGSDEVLAFVFQALLVHDRPILFPDISYSFYPVYCQLYGIDYRTVPLDESMAISAADYLRPENANVSGIVFPNPNAPTGYFLPLVDVERIVAAHPQAVVVVDEAYVDFGGASAIPLIDRYPNVLIIQTLSKSRSLAGLRVGLAMGHPDLIDALVRVKDSFNSYPLDRLALAGACAAFEDEPYFEETRQKIIDSRNTLTDALKKRGFEVIPSSANFLFARHPRFSGATLYQGLRAHSVIVRHFNKPRIADYLRITVGTPEQNNALLTALDRLVTS